MVSVIGCRGLPFASGGGVMLTRTIPAGQPGHAHLHIDRHDAAFEHRIGVGLGRENRHIGGRIGCRRDDGIDRHAASNEIGEFGVGAVAPRMPAIGKDHDAKRRSRKRRRPGKRQGKIRQLRHGIGGQRTIGQRGHQTGRIAGQGLKLRAEPDEIDGILRPQSAQQVEAIAGKNPPCGRQTSQAIHGGDEFFKCGFLRIHRPGEFRRPAVGKRRMPVANRRGRGNSLMQFQRQRERQFFRNRPMRLGHAHAVRPIDGHDHRARHGFRFRRDEHGIVKQCRENRDNGSKPQANEQSGRAPRNELRFGPIEISKQSECEERRWPAPRR